MSITIDTKSRILIDNKQTGLAVTQTATGTIVYTPEGSNVSYKEHKMPHERYSLAHDKPASGVPGRSQFEIDLKEVLAQLND